ncbi:MAG: RidA family protein [Flavobacteriales bacterium]|nr:RidA family protein [Flavobacteriales bacterium]MBT7481596.1 RidA family protein [Flavobacteriales bacterium]
MMSKKVITTPEAPEAIGPYSQAILSGNTLYCSGQIAINPETGELVMDNITEETHQVMKNISEVLKAANMDFKNVVKCSIFMNEMNQYSEINEVYSSYFSDNPPAREAVEVSVLPKNVNVEISVIAVK